jgi:putative spermidine/putrescine transport system permease protein
MLGGRQGLVPNITNALFGERLVFAYSMVGLFIGYIYFSIPRTILTVIAAAEKLDPQLIEAARSLGASNWRVMVDVLIPGLKPALLAAGAICFATSMGAFGTAFTLATKIDVLPMIIYTEFTLQANIAMAAALSFVLGLLTWSALAFAAV